MGLGQAYVVDGFDEWRGTLPLRSADLAGERSRLAEAEARARDEIARLSQHISELVGEDHGAILQAQLMIMKDRNIQQDLDACLQDGASAEGAIFATLDKYVAAFQRVATPFFQERVYDIKDVFHRLLWQLRPRARRRSRDPRQGRSGGARGVGDGIVRRRSRPARRRGGRARRGAEPRRHPGAEPGHPHGGTGKRLHEPAASGPSAADRRRRGQVTLDPPADCVLPARAARGSRGSGGRRRPRACRASR